LRVDLPQGRDGTESGSIRFGAGCDEPVAGMEPVTARGRMRAALDRRHLALIVMSFVAVIVAPA
jgi:hypothetical protein